MSVPPVKSRLHFAWPSCTLQCRRASRFFYLLRRARERFWRVFEGKAAITRFPLGPNARRTGFPSRGAPRQPEETSGREGRRRMAFQVGDSVLDVQYGYGMVCSVIRNPDETYPSSAVSGNMTAPWKSPTPGTASTTYPTARLRSFTGRARQRSLPVWPSRITTRSTGNFSALIGHDGASSTACGRPDLSPSSFSRRREYPQESVCHGLPLGRLSFALWLEIATFPISLCKADG